MERWKTLPNSDYAVSDEGRFMYKGKIKSYDPDINNYIAVYIGNGEQKQLHRLVADLFIGPTPTPEHEVNHIDRNKRNNKSYNLEWVTKTENMQHAARTTPKKEYPVNTNKITLTIDADLMTWLQRKAKSRGRSLSNLVNRFLRMIKNGELTKTKEG